MMKKTMNQYMSRLAAVALAMAALTPAMAQTDDDDDEGLSGFAKVWVKAVAAPEDKDLGNSVRVNSTLWRASREAKNTTFAVSEGYARVTIGAKEVAQKQEGYKFAGWYLDDGDGLFDITKDARITEGDTSLDVTVTLDEQKGGNLTYTLFIKMDEGSVFATDAEAKAAADVEEPVTLFAYFSDGDFVSTATGGTDLGTVAIDKVVNHPGDEITLTATPAEGFVFDYWKDAAKGKTIVSTENPWTTTAQGSTTYYAVFSKEDALTIDFPEEGGFKVIVLDDANWVADEAAGLTNYLFDKNDLIDQDGRQLLAIDNEDAQRYTLNKQASTYWSGTTPNFVYGKGRVKLSYSQSYGEGRVDANLILYADKAQVFPVESGFASDPVKDATVYTWNEELQAFLRLGDTHTGTVTVPAGTAYLLVRGEEPAEALAIGTTPEAYDAAISYLESLGSVVPGDVDGNGTIDVTDVTLTISYILGETPDGFLPEAADVNNDGGVDVTDVTTMIDLILNATE